MSERKKILILFEGGHIAYSPMIAQLYHELEKDFDVQVFAEDPKEFSGNVHLPFRPQTYKINRGPFNLLFWVLFKVALLFSKEARLVNRISKGHMDYFFRFFKIKKFVKSKSFDKIICVDIINLFFVNTVLKTNSYFLSLELCKNENLLPFINTTLIDCVIIQSPLRYTYLFKNTELKTFYIQNAPAFNRSMIKEKRKGLIYTGTAWDPFGFGYCLQYLKENTDETLTVLGAVKDDLINKNQAFINLVTTKRLILIKNYIPDVDVVPFIADYEIGFCFYNFDYAWIDNFNYKSAPSGKMFKYLAAGIPVICNKTPGFEFVGEFKCGIRLDNFDPGTIRSAIEKIRSDYAGYVQGAIAAAEHFSFDKSIKPFIDFAKEDISLTEG